MSIADLLDKQDTVIRFIEFGKIFDKSTRKFLVHFIASQLLQLPLPEGEFESQYFEYLKRSITKLLDYEPLLKACRNSQALAQDILADILKWIEKINRKIEESNPYYREWITFQAWRDKPTFLWRETWQNLLHFLQGEYERNELDTDFYREKLKDVMRFAPKDAKEQAIIDAQPEIHVTDVVIHDLLAQWDALLSERILRHQIEQLSVETESMLQLLHAKIDEYNKLVSLISPLAIHAGRFWDMSRGLWKDAGFDILDKYQELLANETAIAELVEMLGRMRQAEIELEEETLQEVVIRKEWITEMHRSEEVNGVHNSNEITRVLPSEVALLADNYTEPLFWQKYADSRLLTFRYESKRLIDSNKITFYTHQRQKLKEKGPFILCVDTSGSMFGTPAQIAKVLCFAIMKMAAREQRKCFLINFSIGIKTIHLHDIAQSMDKIVEFLRMQFDGGTDVTPALSAALEMLQTNDYRDADVLMVSDFVMFEIRADILERIRREQHKGTRFYSLIIGRKANSEVLAAFDNCWFYDATNKQVVKQLISDLQTIGN
ncbi:MAG: VWA domain-containing protein [Cytophagales bacterium]|nr:VWA domain-containing protein [Cytophagales bacterium]MDW8383855.1 VWA domain-containing protein [Flammeovirgaceae bacterium]